MGHCAGPSADVVVSPARFLRSTFPPLDAAKSYTLDVKWPTAWIYCSLSMERGERSGVIPSSRRVTVRRHDRSAPCWTLPELFKKGTPQYTLTKFARFQLQSDTWTRLSSGRLRHLFDLKCNWYQCNFQQNPTKTTHCSLDALLFCFFNLCICSMDWNIYYLLFVASPAFNSWFLWSILCLCFLFFYFLFKKKNHKRKVSKDPAEMYDISDWIAPFL